MKPIILLATALICAPIGVFAQTAKVRINLRPQTTFQTIENISGNYCQSHFGRNPESVDDAVGQFVTNRLKPTNIRFAIPAKHWEPVNDNDSPLQLNWEGFKDEGFPRSLFEMLRRMKQQNGVTTFTGSIWDLPEWMISNPERREQRQVKPEMYAELAENMMSFVRRAKDTYGVTIDYLSFNESDGGYQILFSPQEMIDFIKAAIPVMKQMGVSVKFLTGDVHKTDATLPYVTPILADASIRPYLGPISYHSWWSSDIADAEFEKIAALGKKYNLPVWCAEVGYDAFLWKTPELFSSWKNAWELAKIYHRILRYSRAVVTHYWTFQNNYPLASPDTLTHYPAFAYTERLVQHFQPGTVIIDAADNDPDLWVLAGKLRNGKLVVQVLNIGTTAKEASIERWQAPTAQVSISSAASAAFTDQTVRAKSGKISVYLPPQSIAFIRMP